MARTSPVRASPMRETAAELRYSSPSRRGPLLHVREEDELVQSLRDLIRIENEIEGEKTRLANQPDFNLRDAFEIFDTRRCGWITSTDLRDGLSAIGLYPTHDEVELWIARYDANGDRRITAREFETAFVAQDAYYASMVQRRPSNYRAPIYKRDDCFSAMTANEYRNVWRTHFRSETQAESIR